MNRRFKSLRWLAVEGIVIAFVVVGIVYALETTIDGFAEEGNLVFAGVSYACGSDNFTSIFGNYRDIQLIRTSGSGTVLFQADGTGDGSFSNPSGGYGELLLQWDGDDDSATCPLPAPSTSLDVDLTEGGATQLVIEIDSEYSGASVKVRVYLSGGSSSDYAQYTWSSIGLGAQYLSADFSSFTENGTWDNDTSWDDVGAVTMYVQALTNASDISFDYIATNNPTAITLAAFEATPQDDAILVTWETAMELDNVGFNLYRSAAADGDYTLLNDTLIPPQFPGEVMGGVYEWRDTDVQPGVTYFYKLEDIDVKGVSTFHGPVSTVVVAAPTVVGVRSASARGALLVPVTLALLLAGFTLARRRRR